MDRHKKALYILIALACVWGLLFAFRSQRGTPVKPQPPGGAAMPARSPAPPGVGLPRLKTELLRVPLPAYPPEVQNIFGTRTALRPAETKAVPVAPVVPMVPAAPPPDPFSEEARRLRYVGFLRAGNTMTAFVIQGQEVHTLEAGATLSNRFRVQAIMEDAILLSTLSGDKQVRLPLAAEAPPGPQR